MSVVRPTPDEIIGTLQRTSYPTLLAEGVDDIVVLRRLEEEFVDAGLSIMPLGGRSAVLEIFERRSELPDQIPVLFLADKDFWVYIGVPDEFVHDRLLFTDGYSIENDLYRDGNFERLLTASERVSFEADLKAFLNWYAISLARKKRGEEATLSTHPKSFLHDPARMAAITQLREGESPPTAEIAILEHDYTRVLRGKSLMSLIIMQLSKSSRPIKHSARSLLEHGSVAGGGWLKRIRDWIESQLAVSTSIGDGTEAAN